jgi:hypothetical protein
MPENYGRRADDIMIPDLNNELANSLTDSQKINIKIIQNLTSLNTALNDTQHDVSVLNKLVVTGNGEPALMERMRSLEAFVNNTKYWLRLVAGAMVLQIITLGLGAVIYFIKLAPLLDKLAKP